MRRTFITGFVVAIAILGMASAKINLSARSESRSETHKDVPGKVAAPAPPQFGDVQCVSNVPKSWGQYRGGSAQSGLSFEDSNGTLRFITNLPCGATPVVALEIRRTGNAN